MAEANNIYGMARGRGRSLVQHVLSPGGSAQQFESASNVGPVGEHPRPSQIDSMIRPNLSDATAMMNNLSTVEIGEYIVNRIGDSSDKEVFLDAILHKVRLNPNLQPVPESPTFLNKSETFDDIATSFNQKLHDATIDPSMLRLLFGSICSKMDAKQLLDAYAYYEAMKKKQA